MYQILGTFTGQVSDLSNGFKSAIVKHAAEKLIIKKNGIESDQVANEKYHGGDMRVIHHYSQKNYDHLSKVFPDIAHRFIPGSFGENIFTAELTESDLCIGDIYQLGTAKVQLTVSRRPCATINYAYQDERILKEVTHTGRTGWFYRVLEEGVVRPGDYLELLESPFAGLSVMRLYEQGYSAHTFSDKAFLEACLQTGLMDKGWKPKLESAINSEKHK